MTINIKAIYKEEISKYPPAPDSEAVDFEIVEIEMPDLFSIGHNVFDSNDKKKQPAQKNKKRSKIFKIFKIVQKRLFKEGEA